MLSPKKNSFFQPWCTCWWHWITTHLCHLWCYITCLSVL